MTSSSSVDCSKAEILKVNKNLAQVSCVYLLSEETSQTQIKKLVHAFRSAICNFLVAKSMDYLKGLYNHRGWELLARFQFGSGFTGCQTISFRSSGFLAQVQLIFLNVDVVLACNDGDQRKRESSKKTCNLDRRLLSFLGSILKRLHTFPLLTFNCLRYSFVPSFLF